MLQYCIAIILKCYNSNVVYSYSATVLGRASVSMTKELKCKLVCPIGKIQNPPYFHQLSFQVKGVKWHFYLIVDKI